MKINQVMSIALLGSALVVTLAIASHDGDELPAGTGRSAKSATPRRVPPSRLKDAFTAKPQTTINSGLEGISPVTTAAPGTVFRTPAGAQMGVVTKTTQLKPEIEPEEVRLRWRGTAINPNPKAQRGELTLQKEIAARLSQHDFVPNVRVAHFRWLDKHPVKVVGWMGRIESTKQTPDGVMVQVRILPNMVRSDGTIKLHADHFKETYLFANGVLQFVGWEDPGPVGAFFMDF
jgi:hypothetical protein